eukprot:scaffold577848_cov38-Prasinocladus_malaysianus.AAC.1
MKGQRAPVESRFMTMLSRFVGCQLAFKTQPPVKGGGFHLAECPHVLAGHGGGGHEARGVDEAHLHAVHGAVDDPHLA